MVTSTYISWPLFIICLVMTLQLSPTGPESYLKGSVEASGLVIDELKLNITTVQAVVLVSFQITSFI